MFAPANLLLREVLTEAGDPRPARALCVVDESLAEARPALRADIRAYFDAHAGAIVICRL